MKKTSLSIWAAAAILLSGGQSAFAAGTHAHQHGGASGEPGNAAEVSRTVEIVMRDNYYEPEAIAVQKDETVRLVVKNEGVLVHEFNIGTAEMHAAHKDEMLMMMRHGVLSPTKIHRDKMEADDGHSMKTRRPQQRFAGTGRNGGNRLEVCGGGGAGVRLQCSRTLRGGNGRRVSMAINGDGTMKKQTTIAFAVLGALLSPNAFADPMHIGATDDMTARMVHKEPVSPAILMPSPLIRSMIDTGEFRREGVGFNGASPGPVLIFEEGEEAVIRVKNNLTAESSHSLARTHSALPDGRRAGHQF